jgi:hypothetical protein
MPSAHRYSEVCVPSHRHVGNDIQKRVFRLFPKKQQNPWSGRLLYFEGTRQHPLTEYFLDPDAAIEDRREAATRAILLACEKFPSRLVSEMGFWCLCPDEKTWMPFRTSLT